MKYPEPFLLATDKGASCRHAVHRGYLPGAKGRAEEGSLDTIWLHVCEVPTVVRFIDRKQNGGFKRLWGGQGDGKLFNGYSFSFAR